MPGSVGDPSRRQNRAGRRYRSCGGAGGSSRTCLRRCPSFDGLRQDRRAVMEEGNRADRRPLDRASRRRLSAAAAIGKGRSVSEALLQVPGGGNLSKEIAFRPLRIAVLTVSDSREEGSDTSGNLLVGRVERDGHVLSARAMVKDDVRA